MKRLSARMCGVESFKKNLQQRQAMIFVTKTRYVLCEEELNPWHIIYVDVMSQSSVIWLSFSSCMFIWYEYSKLSRFGTERRSSYWFENSSFLERYYTYNVTLLPHSQISLIYFFRNADLGIIELRFILTLWRRNYFFLNFSTPCI